MYTLIITICIILLQFNNLLSQSNYGSIFPIPLIISNDDPNFQECPVENGLYAHSTNCSLFHMCTLNSHTIYTCIDGFFFNPSNGQCQPILIENEVKCEIILQKMMDTNRFAFIESVGDYNSYYRRKSSVSQCTQIGIYADILDCSLFHYCRKHKHHEIYKCPNQLHFDPKTFMCSAPELVDCQYEPFIKPRDKSDKICRDHPPGTYLPVINRFDMYIICGNEGRSIPMRCQSGFIYNALTTACEKGPCTFDSTLCKNEGLCVDDPTIEKGFKCICSNQDQGEYCEIKGIQELTTEGVYINEIVKQSPHDLISKIIFDETTHIPYTKKLSFRRNHQSLQTKKYLNNIRENQPFFDSNLEQQLKIQQFIKIVLIIGVTLIGLVLFGAIVFGIVTLVRIIIYSPVENLNQWKTLHEESNI
ncbi:unnamed protein product [Adineta steineri]|uniref:Uncharacterized protein n=1 Tax=Adineta steineri TaxID=433720 RepID=A0A819M0N9_9BILA|nr:unnamed protein product [Adineta steineri]